MVISYVGVICATFVLPTFLAALSLREYTIKSVQWFGVFHIRHATCAAEAIECFSDTVFTPCLSPTRFEDITFILKWMSILAKIGQILTVTHVIISYFAPILAFIGRRNICKKADHPVAVHLTLNIFACVANLKIFFRTAGFHGQGMAKLNDCK